MTVSSITRITRVSGALGALTLAILLQSPSTALAQEGIDLELRGGFTLPVGDVDDAMEVGPMGGAGIGVRLTPRWLVRADLDVDILPGQDVAGFQEYLPDNRLWHYHGGIEYNLTDPSVSPWRVQLRGSAGVTVFDTDPFLRSDGRVEDITLDYFSTAFGGQVGYQLTEAFAVGVGSQLFFTFGDEDETGLLTQMAPAIDAFDTMITLPTYVFVRWHGS